jgi:hypothetical protein
MYFPFQEQRKNQAPHSEKSNRHPRRSTRIANLKITTIEGSDYNDYNKY